jgi:hypothetical protein
VVEDDVLSRVAKAVGRPAATVIAVEDPDERHFIAEAALMAVALYVLKKYADGFLKGLGVERLGEQHGELAIRTLEDARQAIAADPALVARKAENLVQSLRTRVSATARLQAEEAVQRELVEQGLPTTEAAVISARVTTACLGDD